MLTGNLPFEGRNGDEFLNTILTGKYDLSRPSFMNVSLEAKNILINLLKINPL